MKKRIAGIAWILIGATIVQAQEDVSESRWQANKIVIDGNDTEWNKPLNFFDNSSGLIFTITNDTQNIYLCFSNNDKAKTGKMMAAGWSLELFSSEKKRKFDATISFPKSTDPNINIRSDFKTALGIYRSETQMVKTKGFLVTNGDIPLINKEGLNISIGSDSLGKIVYEIQVPLAALMEEDKVKLNELITFDITVNALENTPGKPAAPSNNMVAGRGSSGRMGRGGGRMGGRSAATDAGATGRSSLYDKVSFKQKIKLVSK